MSDEAVILLVEDGEDDVILIRKAFAMAKVTNPIHVVRDGEEAVAYLSGEGEYANRAEHPLPKLILLDLQMPRMNGFQVIEWIRAQETLSLIPVVVLTTSGLVRDVNAAYALGANSFLVKPMDFQDYGDLGRLVHQYWIKTSIGPEASRPASKGEQTSR